MYFYYLEYWAYYNEDESHVTFGNFEVNDNTIDSSDDGIYMYNLYD